MVIERIEILTNLFVNLIIILTILFAISSVMYCALELRFFVSDKDISSNTNKVINIIGDFICILIFTMIIVCILAKIFV